jgi:hypothetical protein
VSAKETPWGPFLFALALQSALEESLAAVTDAHLVAIHDDVTLVATAEKVAALYASLDSHTAPLGLRINPSKCEVYSPTPPTAAEVAKKLGLPHAFEGIVAAGSLIGSRGLVEAFGKEAAAQVTGLVPKLMELPLELQHKHLLLRLSMVPRTTYLLRTGPLNPDEGCMDDSVQEAARCIRRAGGSIIGDSLTSLTAPEQILLPLRLGGCGFPSITPSVAREAQLSSEYLTQLALQNAPAHLRPFDGPHLPALDQMWDAVKSGALGLCAPQGLYPEQPSNHRRTPRGPAVI